MLILRHKRTYMQIMKTSSEFQTEKALDKAWKDLIQAIRPRDISVSVSNGTVTLRGTVESYSKKLLAEQIVCSVSGVKSIINTIEVKVAEEKKINDNLLTDKILDAFVKQFNAPEEEDFTMKIENEWLMIEGKAITQQGKTVHVSGKICKLEQRKEVPVKESAKLQPDYWEIFA